MMDLPQLNCALAATERLEIAAFIRRAFGEPPRFGNRAAAYNFASVELHKRWSQTHSNLADLFAAAAIGSDPEAFTEAGPELLATMLGNARGFIIELEKLSPETVVTLLVLADNCAQAAPADDPRRADHLHLAGQLGNSCWLVHEDAEALEYGVSMLRVAASIQPDDVGIAVDFASALCDWANLTRDHVARAEMLELVDRLPDDSSEAQRLTALSSAMCELGVSIADVEVLTRALPLSERALRMVGQQPHLLNQLGLATSKLATLTKAPDLALRALIHLRQSIDLSTEDDPQLHVRRSNFALAARDTFLLTGEITILHEGVAQARRGVRQTASGHLDQRRLAFLIELLMMEYERGGRSRVVIDEAVSRAQEALDTFRPRDADRAEWLFLLADALWFRYEENSAQDDLMAATRMFRQAAQESQPGTTLHSDARIHLATALLTIGDEISPDLDIAREAVELTAAILTEPSPGSAAKATLLGNHGNALVLLFRRTGDQATLIKGIGFLQQAHAAFRKTGQPVDLPSFKWMFGLCRALLMLYQSSGDSHVLLSALALGNDLWQTIDINHPGRGIQPENALVANNLMSTTSSLVQLMMEEPGITAETRQTAIGLLETVVERARTILADTPDTFYARSHLMAGIGLALDTLDRIIRIPGRRQEAIHYLRSALERAPEDTARPAMAARLAQRLWEGGTQEECDEAIALLEETCSRLGKEDQAIIQANLALMLYSRSDQDSLRRAEKLATGTALLRENSPGRAIRLSLLAGSSARGRHDWRASLTAYQAGIAALPRAAARALSRTDQEKWLKEAQGLAANAADTALRLGDPGLALELLEAGRGILLGQGLEDKADIARLQHIRPDLADRFDALRRAVDPPDLDPAAVVVLQHGRDQERSVLLAEIREIEGEDSFFRALNATDAKELASHGPIVLLNVTTSGSAAIIVKESGVNSVELPDVDAKDLGRHATAILTAYRDDATVSSLLEWLWDTVAEPVLAAVGPIKPTTRVWWVTTGIFGFLPIHAAGYHMRGSSATVIDRCTPSYAITLRSLRHLRTRPQSGKTRPDSLVIGLSGEGLPDQLTEIKDVSRALGATVLDAADASRETVSAMLASYEWVHCAGHAVTDIANPSRSGLVVKDGVTTVTDLSALDLRRGEFAYLSACSTARGGTDLPDEALHVTGAFQLAGYRHVVGTLWPIDDKIARRAAIRFYAKRPPGTGVSAAWTAHALKQVTCELRNDTPGRPSLWASYIHVGP